MGSFAGLLVYVRVSVIVMSARVVGVSPAVRFF